MTPWTNAFMEVISATTQYALYWDEAHYRGEGYSTQAQRTKYRKDLAAAKAKLECSIAVYTFEKQWAER